MLKRAMVQAKKFVYAKRFDGFPKTTDFRLEEEMLPELRDNEILTEAIYLSVDPYMRKYMERYDVGVTMIGGQISRVIDSKNSKYPKDAIIYASLGWRTHTIFDPDNAKDHLIQPYILPPFGELPLSLGLGQLGLCGCTAYFGLLNVCKPQHGEVVVVSGAAGAVGHLVGQIAKIKGCKMTPGPAKNKGSGGSGGSGLKILWIPGRRKHHDKGVYKPTNKNVEHRHGDKKNEPCSLGGSKAHEGIIGEKDKDDKIDFLNPSTPSSTCILPSASLGVATVNVDDHSESESEIKIEKCILRNIEYKKYNIRDSLQSLSSSTQHNHSTQSAGDGDEKRSAGRTSTQKDFDSIECLDDLDGEVKQNGKKSTQKNGKSCKKKTTKEDKAVKCLYYTMMCCECTIS